MDVKNALEAVEAIRGAVAPEELTMFDAELSVRFGAVGEAAGTMAVTETVEVPETGLEKQLFYFLNPNVGIGVEVQLEAMTTFWNELGLQVPDLNDGQRSRLKNVLMANTSRRVVPTPLLDFAGRNAIVEAAKTAFGKNNLSHNYQPLCAPDESSIFGKLLRSPLSTVENGFETYALRYKTPGGQLVNRIDYIAALKEAGQAVEGEDGIVWTFPVMDVGVRSPRSRTAAGSLHAAVDPIATPESLIAMQLLHQVNGTPNPIFEIDFTNEAVYKLAEDGREVTIMNVATLSYAQHNRLIVLRYLSAAYRGVGCGVRSTESGI